ncbi:excitatory amino acid transporter-like isoform X2 [Tachypleus tridentatus]|uniref:excitatory amino acid transporter-like isoform X2 n=1 Tax=Tachypleus tridentatus TaxID=6853 RepID=UPI003FCF5BDB
MESECWKGVKKWTRKNLCSILIFSATVLGFCVGLVVQKLNPSPLSIELVGIPGKLVFQALLMIIVPLLICSIIQGISSVGQKENGRMLALTLILFLGMSLSCSALGAVLGHVVHPGRQDVMPKEIIEHSGSSEQILDSVLDVLRNIIPRNILQATFMKQTTILVEKQVQLPINYFQNVSEKTPNQDKEFDKTIKYVNETNFIGLLFCSLVIGAVMAVLGDQVKILKHLVDEIYLIIIKMMQYLMWFLPVAMFSWICQEGMRTESTSKLFLRLGRYIGTLMGGLIFHHFILLPLLYILIIRKSPVKFHKNLFSALLMAFGSSSSSATLPLTLQCMEEKNQTNRVVTRLVLPLGMTLHMNGSAMMMVLATIFIAQMEGVELGIDQTIVLCLVSLLLVIATPGVINAGNPAYLITDLAAVGIYNHQHIPLILAFDWFLERCRTVNNVLGDCYVAAWVEKIFEKKCTSENSPQVAVELEDATTGNNWLDK